jgi:hypothetical protein
VELKKAGGLIGQHDVTLSIVHIELYRRRYLFKMSQTIPHLPRVDSHPSSPDSSSVDEKNEDRHPTSKDNDSLEDGSSTSGASIEAKSKGVVEMEYLAERINVIYLCLLYGGFALLAYVLSLSKSSFCEGKTVKLMG